MSEHESKYDHEVVRHDAREGYDHTEPAARQIAVFIIVSVISLVAMILAVQAYFQNAWDQAVYEKVLSVPGEEVGEMRQLEAWRLSHYEYTDPTKTTVRLPYERAKELVLQDAAAGKTFYPAKATEPKPEEPPKAEATEQAEEGKK